MNPFSPFQGRDAPQYFVYCQYFTPPSEENSVHALPNKIALIYYREWEVGGAAEIYYIGKKTERNFKFFGRFVLL